MVSTANRIKNGFFTDDTTGLGLLQGNKGFNVQYSSCVLATFDI